MTEDRAPSSLALQILSLLLVLFVAGWLAVRFETIFIGQIGVLAALVMSTVFLRRSGERWRDLGLRRPAHWGKTALAVFAAYITVALLFAFVVPTLATVLELPTPDLSLLEDVRGNWGLFLVLLIPVSWGSAAFGEEMIVRGFLMHRLAHLGGEGPRWKSAVVAQSVLFGLAHAYQGPSGMLSTMLVGLVLGATYLAVGRNLWAVILTHGITDSLSMIAIFTGALSTAA